MSLLRNLPASDKKGWPYQVENLKEFDPSISWPKISIVTPSYNQGKYIEETIRSVLLQNYPNLEYIIIDGGSKDETTEIIKKYEPWITYWVSERDRGQSSAINKGLERCTGEIFNWLNSDDWYEPNALFDIAKQFINNPQIQVVSSYENHISTSTQVTHKGTFLDYNLIKTIERCEITQPSTFFRLGAIKAIGPIADDLHYIMDGDLWVRFLLLYGQEGFCKIEKPLVNFRLHESSKTVSNALVNNFLIERSSIILDLLRFVKVPEEIRIFWANQIYKSPKVYDLNRNWKLNKEIITEKDVRTYFIKKYTIIMLQQRNLRNAFKGIKKLVLNKSLDFFILKSLAKLITKTIIR